MIKKNWRFESARNTQGEPFKHFGVKGNQDSFPD